MSTAISQTRHQHPMQRSVQPRLFANNSGNKRDGYTDSFRRTDLPAVRIALKTPSTFFRTHTLPTPMDRAIHN